MSERRQNEAGMGAAGAAGAQGAGGAGGTGKWIALLIVGLAAVGLAVFASMQEEKSSVTPVLPVSVDALLLAAETGKTAEVEAALREGVALDAKDARGRTALTVAIIGGQPAMVDMLLARGADVNEPGASGDTPLMLAANLGDLPLVERLLGMGAEVGAVNHLGVTALHTAARSTGPDTADLVERLIAAGADLEAKDNEGFTPLLVAASRGRVAPVQALLKAGAEVNARNRLGMTPLMYAVISGDFTTRADWQFQGNLAGVTAQQLGALLAMMEGVDPLECVHALLGAGADVNARDSVGWTAIMRAALIGNTDRFRTTVSKTQASAYDERMEETYERMRRLAKAPEITRVLRNSDAVVNYVSNDRGISALDLARAREDKDGPIILGFLLEGRQTTGPGTTFPRGQILRPEGEGEGEGEPPAQEPPSEQPPPGF